ncbi:MAG: class I SAM-dependent methyltransferase [Burkholderiales bacterium]|nr:class I SAM-dependent methyltransferase [Burkholderiales bacterium]
MSLATTYRFIAPFYDAAIERATASARRASLAHLGRPGLRVLVSGIGTGLDVPHLPQGNRYVGIDLTRAMLDRIPKERRDLRLVQGDAMRLPFAAATFDAVVLHLILAVVPDPRRCLAEAARVLKPGGEVLVFDKFLRPGERGTLRRALNPLSQRLATRLDVVFEDALAAAPSLALVSDERSLAGGWFRRIRLAKRAGR